ncbi:MAG TPA: hypothetical protein VHG89_00135 [Verrucomicrobiae bacterium]|nr:hypothetical protein [Verrucomicrobiae bacterium]
MLAAKTFAGAFAFAVISCVIQYFQGKGFHIIEVLWIGAFMGGVIGIFVAVFTPREITWNDEGIKIRTLFRGSGDFRWSQLKAWSPNGRGTFLIKFEGRMTFQIAPAGFRSEDWDVFRSFFQQRFPDEEALFSFGRPIRFGRKDDA